MTKLYSIGEVSRILNIPTKALRNYDKINLIKPFYTDENTRYRYYNYEQFFTIDVIRYLNKMLNIPLEEIKEFMNHNKEQDKLLALLELHQKQLDKKIVELQYSRKIVNEIISDIKYREKFPEKTEIYEQYLLTRNLYYIELDISIYDIDKYVNRNTIDSLNMNNSENNIMCSVYSIREYKKTNQLQVKSFGIFSDKKIPKLKEKVLPEGRYITKPFLYSEENCSNALSEIVEYAQNHSIKIEDTIYLISKMVNLPAHSKYTYYMELQVKHLL